MQARLLARLAHLVFVAGHTARSLERRVAVASIVAVWLSGAIRDVTSDSAPACVALAHVTRSVARAVARAVEVGLIRIARTAWHLAVRAAVADPRITLAFVRSITQTAI